MEPTDQNLTIAFVISNSNSFRAEIRDIYLNIHLTLNMHPRDSYDSPTSIEIIISWNAIECCLKIRDKNTWSQCMFNNVS